VIQLRINDWDTGKKVVRALVLWRDAGDRSGLGQR
jgi:hypothetical protein